MTPVCSKSGLLEPGWRIPWTKFYELSTSGLFYVPLSIVAEGLLMSYYSRMKVGYGLFDPYFVVEMHSGSALPPLYRLQ